MKGIHLALLLIVVIGLLGWLLFRVSPFGKNRWKVLSQIDPDSRVEFDQLLFLDEQRGFAFAHSEVEAAHESPNVYDRLRADEAWVYATTDGGLHWQPKKSLGRGTIVDVDKIPGGSILLVQRYLDQNDNWKAALQISEDDGVTWSKADGQWDILGRQFLDDAHGFLWGNGPQTRLYYTDNHAETWKPIAVPPDVSLQTTRPALHPDGSLFYLNENKLVHLKRQPDRSWREEIDELPFSLTGDMIYADTYGDSETVWIVAHEPPPPTEPQDIVQTRLLRWDRTGLFLAVPGLSLPKGFMVDAIFGYGSAMTLVGANYSGESFFAPVMIFRSEDGGATWRSEKPAIREKARPIAFYGPRHLWAVGTENRLQHREFEQVPQEKKLTPQERREAFNRLPVDDLIALLHKGSDWGLLSVVHRLRELKDKKALPALRDAFAKVKEKDEKQAIAAALVAIGEKDRRYWEFLVEHAKAAVESDMPFPMALDGHGTPIPQQSNPEFLAWVKKKKVGPGRAAEEAIYGFPGDLMFLGMARDPRSFPVMLKGLESKNYLLVKAAAEGLAGLQDKRAIKPIIEACKRAFPEAKIMLAETLVFFDDPEAQAVTEQIIKDKTRLELIRKRAREMGPNGVYIRPP